MNTNYCFSKKRCIGNKGQESDDLKKEITIQNSSMPTLQIEKQEKWFKYLKLKIVGFMKIKIWKCTHRTH